MSLNNTATVILSYDIRSLHYLLFLQLSASQNVNMVPALVSTIAPVKRVTPEAFAKRVSNGVVDSILYCTVQCAYNQYHIVAYCTLVRVPDVAMIP